MAISQFSFGGPKSTSVIFVLELMMWFMLELQSSLFELPQWQLITVLLLLNITFSINLIMSCIIMYNSFHSTELEEYAWILLIAVSVLPYITIFIAMGLALSFSSYSKYITPIVPITMAFNFVLRNDHIHEPTGYYDDGSFLLGIICLITTIPFFIILPLSWPIISIVWTLRPLMQSQVHEGRFALAILYQLYTAFANIISFGVSSHYPEHSFSQSG